jgi:hypothetical protein
MLIGYARCSTDAQDLTAQRDALTGLGVQPDRIYVDHGLPGTSRSRSGCARRWPPAGPGTPSWSPNSTGSPAPFSTRHDIVGELTEAT